MLNPLAIWERMFAANLEMAGNLHKLAESLVASVSVIGVRSGKLSAAARSPMTGDYAEISRMISEKIVGFSKSGLSVVTRQGRLRANIWGQMWRILALAFKGSTLSPSTGLKILSMANAGPLTVVEEGTRMTTAALAPLHKAVTANAKRLARKR